MIAFLNMLVHQRSRGTYNQSVAPSNLGLSVLTVDATPNKMYVFTILRSDDKGMSHRIPSLEGRQLTYTAPHPGFCLRDFRDTIIQQQSSAKDGFMAEH